jgi:hypothetical protein
MNRRFVARATGNSIPLCRLSPILARTNNWNFTNSLHVEKIAVDADQKCTLACYRRTQHRNVRRISAHVWRQIGRQYKDARASKEGGDLISFTLGKIELPTELSIEDAN